MLHIKNRPLNSKQIEALKRNSVQMEDMFNDPNIIEELNEEIANTYDQEEAVKAAKQEGLLVKDIIPKVPEKPIEKKQVTKKVERSMPAQSPFAALPQNDDDLDREIARLDAQRAKEAQEKAKKEEKPKEEAASKESPLKAQIFEALAKIPGAPTLQALEAAKHTHGSIQVVALSEQDIFVFTHLRRSQFKKIQEIVNKAAATEAFADSAEDQLKEKVISRCVLWPKGVGSPEFIYNSRAGVMDTLYNLIMMHSYFMTPQQSMQLTISL